MIMVSDNAPETITYDNRRLIVILNRDYCDYSDDCGTEYNNRETK